MNRGDGWERLDDREDAEIRAKIAENFTYKTQRGPAPLHFGRDRWQDSLNALLYHAQVDPFSLWLDSLPEWDGKDRVDIYLSELFTVDDTDLTRWAGAFLMLGPIERCFEPGAKLDEMPVFVGAQNIGKSALLRSILPPDEPDWFGDGLLLAADDKKRAESLQGRVIVECSEMSGSTRADLESLKAFVTRQNDGVVRLSYRRNPELMLRRCILAGTTNRHDALPNDPSGNRRFVPVDLHDRGEAKQAIEPFFGEHRPQLWAEAFHRFVTGERAGLPRHLRLVAAEAAEQHRNRDELLEDRVGALTLGDGCRLAEIAEAVGMVEDVRKAIYLSMRDQKRLAAALRNAGWECRLERADGKVSRLWRRV